MRCITADAEEVCCLFINFRLEDRIVRTVILQDTGRTVICFCYAYRLSKRRAETASEGRAFVVRKPQFFSWFNDELKFGKAEIMEFFK